MVTLSAADKAKLASLHPDIRKVVLEAARISTVDFGVGETARSPAQQAKNVASGVSWTLRSRHIKAADGLVYAVDLLAKAGGKVTWSWPIYYKLAAVIKQAAKNVGVPVEWGGDWKKNKDGPHWQLPWKLYPGTKK